MEKKLGLEVSGELGLVVDIRQTGVLATIGGWAATSVSNTPHSNYKCNYNTLRQHNYTRTVTTVHVTIIRNTTVAQPLTESVTDSFTEAACLS